MVRVSMCVCVCDYTVPCSVRGDTIGRASQASSSESLAVSLLLVFAAV